MSLSMPKRLSLAALVLLAPGLLFFAWWGWQGQVEKLRSDELRIRQFEASSAFRITKGLGDELFKLEKQVGMTLAQTARKPGALWPESAGPALDAYLSLARYPGLIQDAYWVSVDSFGVSRWFLWSPKGWSAVPMPGWFSGPRAVLTQDFDPVVSFDTPWFTFLVSADGEPPRALVIRYSVKTILETIVPALVTQSFGAAGDASGYEVSLVRRVVTGEGGPGPEDLTVPLVGHLRLSSWVRNSLAVPVDPPPNPGLQWALTVKYLPGGLQAYVDGQETRNFYRALGLSLFVLGGLILFLVSMVLRVRTVRRERVFAALVCHELKTPLAAVRALAENLSEGIVTDPAKIRDYGTRIQDQAVLLEEMAGNLMSLSRGGAKTGSQGSGPVDLEALARAAADRAGVSLELPEDPGPWVALGTSTTVRASLDNLMTNAFKYGVRDGSPPEVSLSLHRRTRWGTRWVGVAVTDHGETRKFRRRLGAKKNAGFRGGLGLALVLDTQRRQGGRTEVKAVPGGGLCFTLWLKEGPQK